MHTSKIVFLLNDDVRTVRVKYDPDDLSTELFKTFDQSIKVDDMVVVESGTRHNMTTAKVVAVDEEVNFDGHHEIRWVVGKIDVPSYQHTLAEEEKAVSVVQAAERRRKKAALRETMIKDHENSIKQLELANYKEEEKDG